MTPTPIDRPGKGFFKSENSDMELESGEEPSCVIELEVVAAVAVFTELADESEVPIDSAVFEPAAREAEFPDNDVGTSEGLQALRKLKKPIEHKCKSFRGQLRCIIIKKP